MEDARARRESILQTVELQGDETKIEDKAFFNFIGLASLKVPPSIASIGDEAFRGCINLKTINLPSNCTHIGRAAFKGCSALALVITEPVETMVIGEDAFDGLSSLTICCHSMSLLKHTFHASSMLPPTKLHVSIPASFKSIPNHAFKGVRNLITVSIPETVESIGKEAFAHTGIRSITIPDTVRAIHHKAFAASEITQVFMSSSVIAVSKRSKLFDGCAPVQFLFPDSIPAMLPLWKAIQDDTPWEPTDLTAAQIGTLQNVSRNKKSGLIQVGMHPLGFNKFRALLEGPAAAANSFHKIFGYNGDQLSAFHCAVLLERESIVRQLMEMGGKFSEYSKRGIPIFANSPNMALAAATAALRRLSAIPNNVNTWMPPLQQPRGQRLQRLADFLQERMHPAFGLFHETINVIENEFTLMAKAHFSECVDNAKTMIDLMRQRYHTRRKGYRSIYLDVVQNIRRETTFPELQKRSDKLTLQCTELQRECLQTASTVTQLYQHAQKVGGWYDSMMTTLSKKLGAHFHAAPRKKLFRVCEKLSLTADSYWQPQRLCDLVRGGLECENFTVMISVLRLLCDLDAQLSVTGVTGGMKEKICITRCKGRFGHATSGGWADLLLNFYFCDDVNRHICEVQLTHTQMQKSRKQMGAHSAYTEFRAALELLDMLGVDPEEGADASEEDALIWKGVEQGESSASQAQLEERVATLEAEKEEILDLLRSLSARVTSVEGGGLSRNPRSLGQPPAARSSFLSTGLGGKRGTTRNGPSSAAAALPHAGATPELCGWILKRGSKNKMKFNRRYVVLYQQPFGRMCIPPSLCSFPSSFLNFLSSYLPSYRPSFLSPFLTIFLNLPSFVPSLLPFLT
jgi:hypothetical protein